MRARAPRIVSGRRPHPAVLPAPRVAPGQFGEVHKMVANGIADRSGPTVVAVKSVIVDSSRSTAEALELAHAEFLEEINVMKRLRHPNLVMLLGVCVEAQPFLAILEYLPAGALDSWLKTSGAAAPASSLLRVLHQVALGMAAMRDFGVLHRDLGAPCRTSPGLQSAGGGWGQA